MKNNKNSQGLSMNTIIIAAIALLVLVVLIAIFSGKMGIFSKDNDKKIVVSYCDAECELLQKGWEKSCYEHETIEKYWMVESKDDCIIYCDYSIIKECKFNINIIDDWTDIILSVNTDNYDWHNDVPKQCTDFLQIGYDCVKNCVINKRPFISWYNETTCKTKMLTIE